MKRTWNWKAPAVICSGLGLVVLGCSTGGAKAESSAPENMKVMAQNRVNVTNLYNDTCGKCHGINGQGGGGGTKSLNTKEKFDQKYDRPFFDAIKKGVPDFGMEAYGETMSDEVIWAMVVHIRELQAKALRAEFGGPKAENGIYKGTRANYRIETAVESGLKTPWAIDWLPDGKMLVTNRPGTLSVVVGGQVVGEVTGIPRVIELGQGGLMEVAAHPNYKDNGWLYLSYTEPGKENGGAGFTKVVRGKLRWSGNNAAWHSQETIWETTQDNYTGSGVHFGCRLVFDKGYLYFGIGERGNQNRAQDLARPNGKIYRIFDDGRIPSDNPFVNTEGAIKSIWSYGHRNPQGLVMDLNGGLWDTEHGPRGGDEVNLIKKGANYGWPNFAFSINYNDSAFASPWDPSGKIAMPAFRWLPSIGACGLDLSRGAAFPAWNGDLLAGGLSGANLDRIRMKDGQFVEREELIFGMGRVRDVSVAPDGTIYVALNQPDKIVRIVPAN